MLQKLKKSRVLRWIAGIFLGIFTIFILFFLSIYFGFFGKIPSEDELAHLKQSEATQILSADGKLIGKYYIFDRQPVEFEKLPEHLINALIAVEDVRYYDHNGIDTRSLMRVLLKSLLLQDKSSGGGSTITLQLAKNLYGRKDYGMLGIVVNKFQETIIASRLEDVYNKQEILSLYFNTVPFSDNTFGIESAAMKFFNKHTEELTLEESAVLVGTLKASHSYNPRIFPEKSRFRRDVVFQQMNKYGYLTIEEMNTAKNKDLVLDYQYYSHDQGMAPYFREQLRKDLESILDTLKNKDGKDFNIYRDGLIVHTTLDFKMQQIAEQAVKTRMSDLQDVHEKSFGKNTPWGKTNPILIDAAKRSSTYKKYESQGLDQKAILAKMDSDPHELELFDYTKNKVITGTTLDSISHYLKFLNAGFLAVEPQTGAVKAWVGGIDFQHYKYDHVSQSKRQVGSTFKPVVYTAALENGLSPCTYFSVSEVTYEGGWTPSNAGSYGEDPYMNYNMKTALSNSINTIAVKVLMETGISNVIEEARKMGIESDIPKVPSIALGTAEINMEELTRAYTSFVNDGKPSTPYYITSIEDGNGNELASFKPIIQKTPAFSERNREIMIEMMKATVNEGTATRLRSTYGLQNDIAGKTGTTQSNKDGWFVGITPNLVAVTWVGSDDHRIGFRTTGIGQGANSALPIFAMFLQELNKNSEFNSITQAKFKAPSNEVAELMNCEEAHRDGLFKRIFGKKDDNRNERRSNNQSNKKEKKGLFKKIFGKKKKN